MRGKIVKKTQEQALQAQYNFKTKVQLARTRKGKESGKVEEAVNHQMVKISVILILIKVNLQRKEMVANIKIKVGKRSSIRGRFSATTTIINGDTLQMSVEVAKEVREN